MSYLYLKKTKNKNKNISTIEMSVMKQLRKTNDKTNAME